MARRRYKGIIVRRPADWSWRQMYGGAISQGSVAGQITYVELYNSSKSGGLIYVWGVNIGESGSDQQIYENYKGTHATAFGGQGPLYSRGPQGYGIVGGFNSVTCVGTEIGGQVTTSTLGQWWPYDFPCCILGPGDSFGVHAAAVGTILDGGLWWQETPEI